MAKNFMVSFFKWCQGIRYKKAKKVKDAYKIEL